MISNYTIVFDLDGTILNNKLYINKSIVSKLKELSINNNILIATGNNYRDTLAIINSNNLNGIINNNIICSNGEIIYNIEKEKIIFKKTLVFSKLIEIIKYLQMNDIYWYIINGNNLYSYDIKYNALKYKDNKRYNLNLIKDYNELRNIEVEKMIINYHDLIKMEDIIKMLKEKFNVNTFVETRSKDYKNITYYQNNILPKDINKYTSLKRVIKSNNIISFGNGINDYELIKYSKYGICYQNSSKLLKKEACYVIENDKNILELFEKYNTWLIKK